MRHSKKRLLGLLLCIVMMMSMSGCGFSSSVEDLMTLPKLPIEYTGLNSQISEILDSDHEYASPTSGRNIQSVQMVDLDGDNVQEAVAFFRSTVNTKPLKVMVFKQQGDTYELHCTIESSGTSIDSVDYQDFTGDGAKEIIIGWKMSADVQTLAIYDVENQVDALMSASYSKYVLEDLNGDGFSGLILFRTDGDGVPVAEIYTYADEKFSVNYSCSLSSTISDINRGSIVPGLLDENTPAIYVTGVDENNRAITDILCYSEKTGLNNIAVDPDTGVSKINYAYNKQKPQDINRDGCIEIPNPQMVQTNNDIISWMSYAVSGKIKTIARTYHCSSGGWYFSIPQEWDGKLGVITPDNGNSNESQITLTLNDEQMVAIYTITGENRLSQATRNGRCLLKSQTATVFAGKVLSESIAEGNAEEFLRQNFNMIVADWVTNP